MDYEHPQILKCKFCGAIFITSTKKNGHSEPEQTAYYRLRNHIDKEHEEEVSLSLDDFWEQALDLLLEECTSLHDVRIACCPEHLCRVFSDGFCPKCRTIVEKPYYINAQIG